MDDQISEMKTLFRKVSAKARNIPASIRGANQVLAEINPEIPVWLEDAPLSAGDYEEDERRDGSVRRWRKAMLLGYAQVGNVWQLAINNVELEISSDEWQNECEIVTQPCNPSALAHARQEIQIQAIHLLPDLVRLLESKGESLLKAMEQAEKLAQGK
jgi:hypothetical protein